MAMNGMDSTAPLLARRIAGMAGMKPFSDESVSQRSGGGAHRTQQQQEGHGGGDGAEGLLQARPGQARA